MEKLRHYIIDYSIEIEHLISGTLGYILDIKKWRESKSFGYGSASLSFNQKMNIVQDLAGIDSLGQKKLTTLMNIRNKFAHVKPIETFADFFALNAGKEVKKQFDTWYPQLSNEITLTDEERYKAAFHLLAYDTRMLLIEICKNHARSLGYRGAMEGGQKQIIQILMEEIAQFENRDEIQERIMKKFYDFSDTYPQDEIIDGFLEEMREYLA